MKDQELANMFDKLEHTRGIVGLGVIRNDIGVETCRNVSKFIESDAFMSVKKFILRDP